MRKEAIMDFNKVSKLLTREMLKSVLPYFCLILAALYLTYKFIDPAPPTKIVISTGSKESIYSSYASIYREYLKADGISLEIRESKGDIHNLELLKDDKSGVDIAFVQDGIANSEGAGSLLSLGSLYYEPLWIFCRCKHTISHLSDLKGKTIAIGKEGDGTQYLASRLLKASGVNAQNSKFVYIAGEEAVMAIRSGSVDISIFVDTPDSAFIRDILNDHSIQLVSINEAEAFTKQFSYLHHLILPEGSIDLEHDIPASDVHLLAPTVSLIVKSKLHPALSYLMLKTVSKVHGGTGMFNKSNEFPSYKYTDFPLSDQASNFYKSGLPFVDKYLPFWAANFVNRILIIFIPVLAVLIPITKIIPTVYTWLIKMKLFRYYGELRFLETNLRKESDIKDYRQYIDELNNIDERVRGLKLPVTFSQHLYELRGNIEFVRNTLEKLESASKD